MNDCWGSFGCIRKYFSSTCKLPSTVLGARDTGDRTDTSAAFVEATLRWEDRRKREEGTGNDKPCESQRTRSSDRDRGLPWGWGREGVSGR